MSIFLIFCDIGQKLAHLAGLAVDTLRGSHLQGFGKLGVVNVHANYVPNRGLEGTADQG